MAFFLGISQWLGWFEMVPNGWLGWYILLPPFISILSISLGCLVLCHLRYQDTKVSDAWWRSPWLRGDNEHIHAIPDPTRMRPIDQVPNQPTHLSHRTATCWDHNPNRPNQGVYGEVYSSIHHYTTILEWLKDTITLFLLGHKPSLSFNLAKCKE